MPPADQHEVRTWTDPSGGLSDAQWDELAGDRFYSTAFWLRLVDREPGARSGGLHVPLPGGGRAAVPVAAVDGPEQLADPHLRWPDLLADRGLPGPPGHGLLVGQRGGCPTHLLAAPDADPTEVAGALLAAVRATPLPHPDGARVALYLTTPDVLALRKSGVGALPVALAVDAWTDLPAGGWDEWLAGSPESRRDRIRGEVSAFAAAGYRITHHPLAEAYDHVGRLAAQTERRCGIPAEEDDRIEAFGRHAELAGDRAEVLLCSDDEGPPVGCVLYIRHGDTVHLRAVGFDYHRLRDAAEHVNLGHHLLAQLPGVRRLHTGTRGAGGGAPHGSRLQPLWLLDLAADGPLHDRDAEVRAHNAGYRDELRATSPEVADALTDADWDPFC